MYQDDIFRLGRLLRMSGVHQKRTGGGSNRCAYESTPIHGNPPSLFAVSTRFGAGQKPGTGILDCCARAASGHAAALLPMSAMNSRRFMPDMACATRAAGFPALSSYHEGTVRS